jgi:hypothetical protein
MNLKREPIAVISSVTTVIEAAIALAVGFGLKWTPEQVGLVMAVVVAVGNCFNVMLTRTMVTPIADPRDDQGRQLVVRKDLQDAAAAAAKA